MDKQQLYDKITNRKIKQKDFEPYDGNNGRVNKCEKLIRQGKLNRGGALLDVGGGIGDLGFAVRDLFDKTAVVDISLGNLEAALAKGNYVGLCDVDRFGLRDIFKSPKQGEIEPIDNFVLITALDFIEHIIDPENFARECFRLLKSGGEVFINTPNIEFWEHIDSLLVHGVFPHTSGDTEVYHGGHLAFYTYLDMVAIFGKAGFVGFEQFKDEEGYKQPPPFFLDIRKPKTQEQYQTECMRLGNPNLLFKCVKP